MITCDWPAAFVLFFLDVFSKTPFPETPSSNAHVKGVRVCELCACASCAHVRVVRRCEVSSLLRDMKTLPNSS